MGKSSGGGRAIFCTNVPDDGEGSVEAPIERGHLLCLGVTLHEALQQQHGLVAQDFLLVEHLHELRHRNRLSQDALQKKRLKK